jgi:cell division protein FtsI (penicillin-binding protein 3)
MALFNADGTASSRPAPRPRPAPRQTAPWLRLRSLVALSALILAFAAIAFQLLRLGLRGGSPQLRVTMAEVVAGGWARPDIVDRHGRLLATDRAVSSLFADPQILLDVDEAVEKVTAVLPRLDGAELRKSLADKSRRFSWVARGLTSEEAKAIHELGLPGLGFRPELRRYYPLGQLAGHILGTVNVDNRGLAGIERLLDEKGLIDPARGADRSLKPPVRLALDIGVQHAVAEELRRALKEFAANAAAALIIDVRTGEIVAAVSLPEVDPNRALELLDPALLDRLLSGSFELGSVYKIIAIALALELGIVDLDTVLDVREPLRVGPHVIKDPYPQGRPLTVREVFLYSSNVGAGMLALKAGADRQRAFLAKLGLLDTLRTEVGPVAPPQLPAAWGRAETITIAYGHGLAVAPLQFAVAAATIINGGNKLTPTFLWHSDASAKTTAGARVLSETTSASLRELMRLGVTHKAGTGRRAETEGYGIGGKTGTAEMPGRGGYREKAVISSFLGAFPMEAPRYATLVMLFEPQGIAETAGRITAGVNAAPVTGRIVARIAPLLGVLPRLVEGLKAQKLAPESDPKAHLEPDQGSPPFDAPQEAQ